MTSYLIPLTPQSQTLTVNLLGVRYQMSVVYGNAAKTWFLSISDSTGTPLIQSLPLVCGQDLLSQFKHLGIGGQLWVIDPSNPTVPPTYQSLGVTSNLYFTVED